MRFIGLTINPPLPHGEHNLFYQRTITLVFLLEELHFKSKVTKKD